MDEITITPDLAAGTAKTAGRMNGGEHPRVRLNGCAALLSPDLRFRVTYAGATLAIFPLKEDDAFAIEGDDLVFSLNLNTSHMLRALKAAGAGEVECDLALDDTGAARTLYFAIRKCIGEWRLVPGEGTPISLDDYRSNRELEAKIEAIAHAMGGDEMPEAPTAHETAEATKQLWKALGGNVGEKETTI